MIADSWRANWWNFPFGAGKETSRGWFAAGVPHGEAREHRPELGRIQREVPGLRGVTATFFPGSGVGFVASVQKLFVS